MTSQGILDELRRSEAIDHEEYSAAVGRLASMHYTFIRISADDIVRRLKVNGYISNEETRAMLSVLRGPDSDQPAAVSVATGLISQVFEKVPAGQLGMLLELTMRRTLPRSSNSEHTEAAEGIARLRQSADADSMAP